MSQVLTKAADGVKELTEQEQDALIDTFASESAALARTRPETFLKLHRDVELVNLDRLIQSYEDALARARRRGSGRTSSITTPCTPAGVRHANGQFSVECLCRWCRIRR